MNPAMALALILDLYSQVTQLTQENAALRAELEARPVTPEAGQP